MNTEITKLHFEYRYAHLVRIFHLTQLWGVSHSNIARLSNGLARQHCHKIHLILISYEGIMNIMCITNSLLFLLEYESY